jgi:hypothetical protein
MPNENRHKMTLRQPDGQQRRLIDNQHDKQTKKESGIQRRYGKRGLLTSCHATATVCKLLLHVYKYTRIPVRAYSDSYLTQVEKH